MAISTPERWGRGQHPPPPSSRDIIPVRSQIYIYIYIYIYIFKKKNEKKLTILDAYNF